MKSSCYACPHRAQTLGVVHQLEVLFTNPEAAVGLFGPVFIVVIAGADRPENAERTLQEMRRLRRTTHAKELQYVYVVLNNAAMPGAKTRELATAIPGLTDSVVGVHEGEGFRASVLRAVVTGIGMVTRSSPEIVKTGAEAAVLLASKSANVGPPEALRAAIEKLRRQALADS